VETVELEIDHTPGRGWFRARGKVEVRAREPVPDQENVTCVIPGHHRRGRELFTDLLEVDAGPLVFLVQGCCAYESTFAYSDDDG
jgi:sortase (surface protein transpeptidase)